MCGDGRDVAARVRVRSPVDDGDGAELSMRVSGSRRGTRPTWEPPDALDGGGTDLPGVGLTPRHARDELTQLVHQVHPELRHRPVEAHEQGDGRHEAGEREARPAEGLGERREQQQGDELERHPRIGSHRESTPSKIAMPRRLRTASAWVSRARSSGKWWKQLNMANQTKAFNATAPLIRRAMVATDDERARSLLRGRGLFPNAEGLRGLRERSGGGSAFDASGWTRPTCPPSTACGR